MNETETAKIKGELYCGATELVELLVKKRKEEEEMVEEKKTLGKYAECEE